MKRFMHKACTGMCFLQQLYTAFYFFIAGAGEATHSNSHRPNHIIPNVWTANTFTGSAFKEERIFG